jgi:hypothetical protein
MVRVIVLELIIRKLLKQWRGLRKGVNLGKAMRLNFELPF